MFENVSIDVMLCCNNPDNGIFDGKLRALEIGPNMSFYAIQWEGRRIALLDNAIRISGKRFPVNGFREWVGNWCWDCVTMRGSTVLELLNWPRFRKFFEVDEAETRLFNWFKAGRTWTDDDLRLISKEFE